MAILKCLNIGESKIGNPSAGLKRCLQYIANPDKTEGQVLTGGNCGGDVELTYKEMVYNKKVWGQTGGRQGEHFIISFPKDENIDKETACKFAEDFCKELLHGEYNHLWAVHVDKDHVHVHLAWDHVNINTGLKRHFGKYSWLAELQPLADLVCKKHGLRTLDFDPENRTERRNQYHEEWEKDSVFKSKKNISWTDIIRADVDIALSKSRTWQEFLQILRDMHYEIKDGKHLSLRPLEKERFTRTGRCGESYTKEALQQRLGEPMKQEPAFGDAEPILRALRDFFQKTGQSEIKGIKVIFYQRWYAYSYVNRSRTPWKYRKELAELGKYTDRCAYLFTHDITNVDDLQKYLQNLQEKQEITRKELVRTNNQIYNTPLSAWRKIERLRAELDLAPEVEKPAIRQQITELIEPLRDRDMMADSEQYRTLQEKKQVLQTEQKKLKAEIKMSTDLIDDFKKANVPGDIMLDPGRFEPDSFNDKCYHRITLNKVLFQSTPEGSDFMKIRIPGSDNAILLYKADTRIAEDGSFASSYIYDHLDYAVIDQDNSFIKTITGKEVMEYFMDRTREKVR